MHVMLSILCILALVCYPLHIDSMINRLLLGKSVLGNRLPYSKVADKICTHYVPMFENLLDNV